MYISELKGKVSLNVLIEVDLVGVGFVEVGLVGGHLLYHATNHFLTCYINKGSFTD